jgi:hypothetical protein
MRGGPGTSAGAEAGCGEMKMKDSGIDYQRLIALFLLGWVLFNFPLLSLFNRPATLFGIPILYIYIFAAWAAVIALVAWVVERRP